MSSYETTPTEDVFQTIVEGAGHISVFMGRKALKDHWPPALRFTLEKTGLGAALTYRARRNKAIEPCQQISPT